MFLLRRHRSCLRCGWCLRLRQNQQLKQHRGQTVTVCRVCDFVTSSNRGSYQHELQSAAGSHRSLHADRPNVLCLNPRVLARCISCRHCVTRRTNSVEGGSKGRTVGSLSSSLSLSLSNHDHGFRVGKKGAKRLNTYLAGQKCEYFISGRQYIP